jgi:hypothetical protein
MTDKREQAAFLENKREEEQWSRYKIPKSKTTSVLKG